MSQEYVHTTMGKGGRVEIPRVFIDAMNLKEKTELIVMLVENDLIIKIYRPNMRQKLNDALKQIDAQNIPITEEEIASEIKAYRRSKEKDR